MAQHDGSSLSASALVSGIAGTLVGLIVGFFVASQSVSVPRGATTPVVAPTGTAAADEQAVETLKDILINEPTNVRAAIDLGNWFYDAGRFSEAVPYYERALALEPTNIHVSTDLGTSLWYAGQPEAALAQFERSLAIDPTHPQTLFNMGIVRRDGRHDLEGAIEVWERLRAARPTTPEAQRAAGLIEEARRQLGTGQPTEAP
jgi:tetratricopeptide (TPR) repeat protein